jgi:hypothetical protein
MNLDNIARFGWDPIYWSVRNSVWHSLRESVCDSFYDSIWDSVGSPIGLFIGDSVETQIRVTAEEAL